MQGEMEDKCGIVGIHSKDISKDVAPLVYYCLYALQHRGQESAGIASFNQDKGFKHYYGMGLITSVFSDEEIQNLETNVELEIFAHGALCYSYSGQCLMSSFKGGRSGNRGTCAQPCRRKYKVSGLKKEDYYLSPCDLSLYDQLKEIAELNISCIKIEGRMRNKEYLAIVVSNYRKALNKLKSGKESKSEEN